jgi:uncharacterized membrane protein YbhN (UPF0104 family)
LLVLCVIAIIAAYRIWGQDFNWSLFLSSLSKMKAGWLATSVVLTLATYWLRAIRWRILLAPLKAVPLRVASLDHGRRVLGDLSARSSRRSRPALYGWRVVRR